MPVAKPRAPRPRKPERLTGRKKRPWHGRYPWPAIKRSYYIQRLLSISWEFPGFSGRKYVTPKPWTSGGSSGKGICAGPFTSYDIAKEAAAHLNAIETALGRTLACYYEWRGLLYVPVAFSLGLNEIDTESTVLKGYTFDDKSEQAKAEQWNYRTLKEWEWEYKEEL